MDIRDIAEADMTSLTAQGYTENDLSMLAKQEVDALLAVPADSVDADSGTSSNSDPHGDAEAAQDKANAAGSETEDAPENKDAPFVPNYTVEVPTDAAEQIKTLKAEERTAFKELMDGVIDSDAYQEIKERVETATDELKTKALTASIFQQANAQAAEQTAKAEWNRAEAASFATFKSEGLDYKAKPALLAAYNTNLRTLGADPKNENRDAAWFLTEAHRLTKDDLGFTRAAPGADVKKDATNVRGRVDPTEMPPTLRNVPIAATGAVNADEFAHMRNLGGLELEKAHARLTPDQRDRWMAE